MKDQQIYLTGAVPVVSIVSAPWVAASYHGIFSRYHAHSVSEIQ